MLQHLDKNDFLILALLSSALFFYHILTSAWSSYGYFIDELYYIACSKRLAFGYVDHPPLSIFLLASSRWFLGDSLPAVRFLSSLGIAGTVFMTGVIVRQLGGSRIALVIAALAVIAMPVYQLMGSFYSMNAFEPLIWAIVVFLVIRMIQSEDARCWLWIGLMMGIGLEMKHTIVLYFASLIAGILLTPSRRLLFNRWFFVGMTISFLLILPNLVWQALNGFPSLEFYRNAMANKNIPTAPAMVVLNQILFANPFSLPLWIGGLGFFFFSGGGKKYRSFGWAYLFLLLVMIINGSSRPDRIAAMYTVLFAGGAAAIASIRAASFRMPAIASIIVMLIVGGMIALPIFTPLLSPSSTRSYISSLGLSLDMEQGKRNEPLPQWLADRLGWRELASDVSGVYHGLPSQEQMNTVIVSTNYGEAGALEYYGPEYGLPHVFATHNSYHSWGSPPDSIHTFIAVFVDRRDLQKMFDSVVEAKVHVCPDCTRQQRVIPIYVARGPHFTFSKEWPRFAIYN